jgi:L-threonylcarbamoyladenylate synthase
VSLLKELKIFGAIAGDKYSAPDGALEPARVIITLTTSSLSQISDVIARGGVIAFRTDTFYGLGADPFNGDAVRKIKQLKGREDHKPILIIVSDRAEVNRFIAAPTPAFDLLADIFWPGPLTLIGQAAPGVREEITAGTKTIGVRLPADDKVRALIEACGGALTGTSANPSHREPARAAAEVSGYFGDTIDLIVDGGEVAAIQPSTVVDVSGAEPRLIRAGAIPWISIQTELNRSKLI